MRDAPQHGVSAREDFRRTASQDATVERKASPTDRKNGPADKASPVQSARSPKTASRAQERTRTGVRGVRRRSAALTVPIASVSDLQVETVAAVSAIRSSRGSPKSEAKRGMCYNCTMETWSTTWAQDDGGGGRRAGKVRPYERPSSTVSRSRRSEGASRRAQRHPVSSPDEASRRPRRPR